MDKKERIENVYRLAKIELNNWADLHRESFKDVSSSRSHAVVIGSKYVIIKVRARDPLVIPDNNNSGVKLFDSSKEIEKYDVKLKEHNCSELFVAVYIERPGSESLFFVNPVGDYLSLSNGTTVQLNINDNSVPFYRKKGLYVVEIKNKSEDKSDDTLLEKDFSLKQYISRGSDTSRELFSTLQDEILKLNSTDFEVNKYYIAFKYKEKNFCTVILYKNFLKLYISLKMNEINDIKNIGRDVSNVGHWGTGDVEFTLKNENDISYVLFFIQQSYNRLNE